MDVERGDGKEGFGGAVVVMLGSPQMDSTHTVHDEGYFT